MISIVMTYYNRRDELLETLKSIDRYYVDGLEVIIVDDASMEHHTIDDIVDNYQFDINLIKIKEEDKTHVNPCVPYNIGFREVKNDIVIIQNPECLHFGDIIGYTIKNLTDNNYLSFSCYNISEDDTKKLKDNHNDFLKTFKPHPHSSDRPGADFNTNMGWHNHPEYRAVGYHWCSAINKKNMDLLNGFDENYADGIGWDDADLYHRISFLGLTIDIIKEPYVIHQFHYNEDLLKKYTDLDVSGLLKKNRGILGTTISNRKYRVNEDSYYGYRD